ncbi:MAG: hypothetical protein ACI9U2_003443 [Bradymonadia bacterium]|jgi:hypothetical protein
MDHKHAIPITCKKHLPPRAASGFDPASAAAYGQSAELIDAEQQVGFAMGAAAMSTVGASAAERAADEQRIAAEVGAVMRASGVPIAPIHFGPLSTLGRFDASVWQLRVNQAAFHQPSLRVRLLGTVYHEARHAEQYFDALRAAAALMPQADSSTLARWLTRNGANVPPLAIIAAACRQPSLAGDGRYWFELYFGAAADCYREAQFRNKLARQALWALDDERARMQGRSSVPKSVQADYDRRHGAAEQEAAEAHTAYENLPDEREAHENTDEVIKLIGRER